MNCSTVVCFNFLFALCIAQRVCQNLKEAKELETAIVGTQTALSRHYGLTCTSILRAENLNWEEERQVFVIAKALAHNADHPQLVTATTFHDFIKNVNSRPREFRCSRSIIVLLAWQSDAFHQFSQLSRVVGMSEFLWLIILPSNTTTQDLLKEVDTPFDALIITACIEDTVHLEEAYRVDPSYPLRVQKYGSWDGTKLTAPSFLFLYNQRKDMEGFPVKAATKDDPPISELKRDPDGSFRIDGYFGLVYYELAERLNFTPVYVPSVENVTGSSVDGVWSGLIGMLQREEIDLAVGPVTFLKSVMEAARPVRPLLSTNYQIFFNANEKLLDFGSILKPFGKHIWLCISVWVFVGAVAMSKLYQAGALRGSENQLYLGEFSGINSLLTFLRALCQQGNFMVPESVPCRILFFTGYVFSLVLLTAYSASLISSLTVQQPRHPFDSLETFLRDGTYKLIAIGRSTDYTYFSEATDPLRQEIFQKTMQSVPESLLPMGKEKGIQQVCDSHKIALFITEAVTQITARQFSRGGACQILSLAFPLDKVFLTIARKKKFPFAELLDHQLQFMDDTGILRKVKKGVWGLKEDDKRPHFVQLQIDQVVQIYCVWLFGVGASLLILAVEILYNFHCRTSK